MRALTDDWQSRAQCADLPNGTMYPVDAAGNTDYELEREVAFRHCLGCPVADDCLAAGLYEKFGVWGGLTSRERARLRRRAA